jgi:hypothetical protein
MKGATFLVSRSLALMLASLSVVVPPSSRACDQEMIWAWKRTWHAPNALATPLRGYFIPRYPGRCDREAYAGGWSCANNLVCAGPGMAQADCMSQTPRWDDVRRAGIGFEPVQFERLGQIPNDFGLEGVPPAEASAPRGR